MRAVSRVGYQTNSDNCRISLTVNNHAFYIGWSTISGVRKIPLINGELPLAMLFEIERARVGAWQMLMLHLDFANWIKLTISENFSIAVSEAVSDLNRNVVASTGFVYRNHYSCSNSLFSKSTTPTDSAARFK